MRITTKGQVTIPQHIRERHGFYPGTDVVFEEVDGEVRVRKAPASAGRGRRLVAHMRGRGSVELSTDEIMALTRGGG